MNISCIKNALINFVLIPVLTLVVYALIVNFAPMRIANIFLNPIGVAQGLQYEQERMQAKEAKQSESKFKDVVSKKKAELYNSDAPYFGAENPKLSIVIFSDYKCGYCRALSEATESIAESEEYKDVVRFIIKDYPILGQASGMLAVAGIEAFKADPASFDKVHAALFNVSGQSKEEVIAVVQAITGKTITMNEKSPAMSIIQQNLKLGQEMGVRGTPGIIIGDEFIAGYLPEPQLRAKINEHLSK